MSFSTVKSAAMEGLAVEMVYVEADVQYFCCACRSLSGVKLHGMDCKLSKGLL